VTLGNPRLFDVSAAAWGCTSWNEEEVVECTEPIRCRLFDTLLDVDRWR
jgi:hypothetical protein